MSLLSWLFPERDHKKEQNESREAYRAQLRLDIMNDLIASGMGRRKSVIREPEDKYRDFVCTHKVTMVSYRRKNER